MSFISIKFVLFVILVFGLYYIMTDRFRYLVLLTASVIFYLLFDIKSIVFLLISSFIVYLSAVLIEKKKKRKAVIAICIIANISLIVLMKYTLFISSTGIPKLSGLFAAVQIHLTDRYSLIVPLGISFYTLALIGYLIDVYRGKYPCEKNFLRILLFASYFPHILQGPIARYDSFRQQLNEKKVLSYDQIKDAVLLIIWGYMKKMIIADRAAIFVDAVYGAYMSVGGTTLFIASLLYSIQIYADFSGCVDIALGVSKLFGIDLIDNFKQPYFSDSINDFWRRWHISLSSWFRDYLYFPLGGNRKGVVRRWVNVLIVFTVSGLWHGAGWNFIVWGLLHGIYQVIGYILTPVKNKIYGKIRIAETGFLHVSKVLMTFLLVNFAWILFRITDIHQGIYVIQTIFTHPTPWDLFSGNIFQYGLSNKVFWCLMIWIIIMIIVDYLHYRSISIRNWIRNQVTFVRWTLYLIAIFSILFFGVYGVGYNAADFIYMQF